jgi:hypothetical protein
MTILTAQQIDTLRALREEHHATSAGMVDLPGSNGLAWVVLWRADENEPVARACLYPDGRARVDLLVTAA